MMCIIGNARIAFCAQVEGTRGEILAASPLVWQFRSKHVPNEPNPKYGYSWPQHYSVGLKYETDRERRNGETVTGGRYAM